MATFRLLEKELQMALLTKELAERSLDVSGYSNSDSAYEDSIIELDCRWLPDDSIQIIIARSWDLDGNDIIDSEVYFRHNGVNLVARDLSNMLRSKLDQPLRQIVRDDILNAASTITGAKPK